MKVPPRARAALASLAALLVVREARAQRPPARLVNVRTALLRGAVRFEGAVPARAPLPVNPHAAHMGCGAEPPRDESLVVDPASNGVRGTVVWLEAVRAPAPPAVGEPRPEAPVSVEQTHCAFAPHVLAVRTNTAVRFGNGDTGVLHNVHAYVGLTGEETAFNLATPAGLSATHAFTRVGVHRVVCDAGHGWMLLYAHAFAHPYFAVSDARGAYAIGEVPAGRYVFRAWHEGVERGPDDAQGRPTWGAPLVAERQVAVIAGRELVLPPLVLTAAPAPTLRFGSATRPPR